MIPGSQRRLAAHRQCSVRHVQPGDGDAGQLDRSQRQSGGQSNRYRGLEQQRRPGRRPGWLRGFPSRRQCGEMERPTAVATSRGPTFLRAASVSLAREKGTPRKKRREKGTRLISTVTREKRALLISTVRGPSANRPECHEPLGRSKQGWSITKSIVEPVACDCLARRAITQRKGDTRLLPPWERGRPLAPRPSPSAICHLPRPAPGDSLWNRAGGGITMIQVTPATRRVS